VVERPAFSPRWQVTLLRGEGVFFVATRDHAVFEGETFELVTSRIDGRRRADAIAASLRNRVDPALAYYALLELERRGCIEEARDSRNTRASSEALKRLGAVASERSDRIRIVLSDSYLSRRLARINRGALSRRAPWILMKVAGDELCVGPMFVPGGTPCWSCLAHRLAVARPVEAYVAARHATARTLAVGAPASAEAVAALARVLSATPLAGGEMMSCDTSRLTMERHVIARRPQCPVCGQDGLYATQLERVDLARVTSALGARISTLVNPFTGLTMRVAKVASIHHSSLHVFAAAPMQLTTIESLVGLKAAMRNRNTGSGRNESDAFTAALGETVERYCSVAQGDEPRVRASLARLGPRAIHPNDCMLFSNAQYRARSRWNARGEPMTMVPVPFDPRADVDWTPVWSLSRNEHRMLPTAFLYGGARAAGRATCISDSNGNAAGDSLADAIVRGFLEVVERDSIALWWYGRTPRPSIDVMRLRDSYFRDVVSAYRELGREYWLLDITSDLGVPVCAAVTRRVDCTREEILFGFGAHFDIERAALRAVKEMNQMVVLHATTRSVQSGLPPTLASWTADAVAMQHPYLLPGSAVPRDGHVSGRSTTTGMGNALEQARRIADRHGLELLVLDLTRPDVGVAAVKVIVPGLRPAAPRFAPGRLYDAPVRAGWCAEVTSEAALNPVPFFL
jgi:ribosomal protein S12 methylthiotransferase accessory factor